MSIAALSLAPPALASDEDMEFRFNPSANKPVDGPTSVALERPGLSQRPRLDQQGM